MKKSALLALGLMLAPATLCVVVAKNCSQAPPSPPPPAPGLPATAPSGDRGSFPPPPIDPATGQMLEPAPIQPPEALPFATELQPACALLDEILKKSLAAEAAAERERTDAQKRLADLDALITAADAALAATGSADGGIALEKQRDDLLAERGRVPLPAFPDRTRADRTFEAKLADFRQCIQEKKHEDAIQALHSLLEQAPGVSPSMLMVLKNDLTLLATRGGN